MKLGFMMYSLSGALANGTFNVQQALQYIRKCGVAGVDLDSHNTDGNPPALLGKMTRDEDLAISCFIGGADLTVEDKTARRQAIDSLRRHIDGAFEMQADKALLTTGVCAEGFDRAEGRRLVIEGLQPVVEHGEQAGITVMIEDFGSLQSPYQTSDECMEVLQGVPGLKMNYDTGNMFLGDENSVEFLHVIKDYMVHAHAKDWTPVAEGGLPTRGGKRYIGTVVGQGELDYPAIISELKALKYKGYLSFEYEGNQDPVAAAKQGTQYLLDLING